VRPAMPWAAWISVMTWMSPGALTATTCQSPKRKHERRCRARR